MASIYTTSVNADALVDDFDFFPKQITNVIKDKSGTCADIGPKNNPTSWHYCTSSETKKIVMNSKGVVGIALSSFKHENLTSVKKSSVTKSNIIGIDANKSLNISFDVKRNKFTEGSKLYSQAIYFDASGKEIGKSVPSNIIEFTPISGKTITENYKISTDIKPESGTESVSLSLVWESATKRPQLILIQKPVIYQ